MLQRSKSLSTARQKRQACVSAHSFSDPALRSITDAWYFFQVFNGGKGTVCSLEADAACVVDVSAAGCAADSVE